MYFSLRKIQNLCIKWSDFEKVNFSFFALIFQFSYCQNYWKIDSLSKDEEKIDIGRDFKNISLKSKNFTKKFSA